MNEAQHLTDRTAVVEAIDAIFDLCDAKDWDALEGLFADKVAVDFTSLAGGDPVEVTNAQLVDGWRVGLHARKQSFHMVGHYRVTLTGESGESGDTAEAHVKGYAYNLLDADLGGGMWEVWGTYAFTFVRSGSGSGGDGGSDWKATGMTFDARHSRGDDAVRTHSLS